ncbi:hypothetical protein L1987_06305 [Smallanthus sonchifolius]|uniref:Uncharacterized protein n=1 Tax=Smallanthus sonchifolius TaxID=185202 RepID=A0ACB9JXS0_9ASTR|nr:hypothetical protein L1987_06305 [Smallanthus sonchifolius]
MTEEAVLLDRFVDMEPYQHCGIDWGLMEELGQLQRLQEYIDARWTAALACDAIQYRELTVEFHSTFWGRRGGPEARLELGPYISRLEECLGFFDRYPGHLLTPGPDTIPYGLYELRLAGIVMMDDPSWFMEIRQGPNVPPPTGMPAEQAVQMGAPTPCKRILHHIERPQVQNPLRVRPPAPLTLEELRDQLFDRLHRQDAAIRYIMQHQGIEIPPFFRAPDQHQPDQLDTGGDP